MNTPYPLNFSDFDIGFNQIPVEKLFQKYDEIGFLYPAKKALLAPFFDQITQNWKRLLHSDQDLLWMLTKENPSEAHFASISVWKQSNYCMLAQHLVSNGNPFLSLKVMLAAQVKAIEQAKMGRVQAAQNWFRPNNRYAYRVFASMYDKLGPERAALISHHYMHAFLDKLPPHSDSSLRVEQVDRMSPALLRFIRQQHGSVFVRAEELDQPDLQLTGIQAAFRQLGLDRSRHLFQLRDPHSQEIMACVIANRAPLGLNFSFLENRAYYLLSPVLDEARRKQVLAALHQAVKACYQDFELQLIPIVTDAATAEVISQQGGIFCREYLQSIWMKAGFWQWYEHIDSFLKQIEARYMRAAS